MVEIKAPKIERILINRVPCTTNTELETAVAKISDGSLMSVEIKQIVPNPDNDQNDFLSAGFRLQGHTNWRDQKETKELLVWLNITKIAFGKTKWEIGKSFTGYNLNESYVPVTELAIDNGLDKNGNVLNDPIINPDTKRLMLYRVPIKDAHNNIKENKLLPKFRLTKMSKSVHIPKKKPSPIDDTNFFEGDLKKNGKKSPAYQNWLNDLIPKEKTEMEPLSFEDVITEQVEVEVEAEAEA